ncbi:hypothetical protein M0805_008840 [Coniferiporia weirii]|nr:hypothetical protein M0805_008840 [Coniferiporia weirii]
MSMPSQPDRQIGLLSRLVDDALLRILCHCDIIDLLRIEQTCKYLRSLVANREVWFTAVLRLPREASPSIAPHQTSEEADFRKLAVKAIRGYKNWTSEHPTPLHRRSLDLSPAMLRRSELQLLPGGRYMIYFLAQTMCCFDVVRNQYVVKYELDQADFLNFVYDMNSDGTSVRTFIASMSTSRPGQPRAMNFEYIDIDLNICKNSPPHSIVLNWSELERAAEVNFMILRSLAPRKHILLATFEGEDLVSRTMTRVGILIDFEKEFILILTFKFCDSDGDHKLPIRVANNHLLYLSGRRTGNPTVHAVPLSYFEMSWQKISDSETWISHKVKAGRGTHFSFVDHRVEAPVFMHIGIHNATWLDLKSACSRDPTITYLSLVDVGLSYDKPSSGMFGSPQFPSFFHLQFSESRDPFSGELSGQFSLAEGPAMIPVEFLSSRIVWGASPSRHGRMVAFTRSESSPSSDRKVKAVSLLRDSVLFTSLTHLKPGAVQHFAMDFYTGIVIVSISSREPNSGVVLPGSTEFFVEYYD